MPVVPINSFLGIDTNVANPKIGTAQSTYGLVRNRTRGHLELPDGYSIKNPTGTPTSGDYNTPVSDTYNTLIVEKDIHSFFVAEHGGRNVTVFIGTYTKISRYDAGVGIPRFGVWIRPYWNGGSWIDSWFELTEIELVETNNTTPFSGVSTINFTADTGKATDYFKNWIVVFEDWADHDNYLLVQNSTGTSVTYFGDNSLLTRYAGDVIILCRSFLNGELPSTINSYIFNYLNEIRMTSGNNPSDVSLMSGFRSKTYSWATSDAVVDRIVLDVGCLNVWRYAVLMNSIVTETDLASPLKSGTYSFKIALGTDDNQIAAAQEAFINQSNFIAVKFSAASALGKIAVGGGSIFRPDYANPKIIHQYSLTDFSLVNSVQIYNDFGTYNFDDFMVVGENLFVMYKIIGVGEYWAKIDIPSFTLTSTTQIVFVHTTSTLDAILYANITDGTYIYGITPSEIIKYTTAMSFVSSIATGGTDYNTDSVVYNSGYIYYATRTSYTNTIYKVDAGLTTVVSIAVDAPDGSGAWNWPFNSMCIIGNYLYTSSMYFGSPPQTGIWISKKNISDLSAVSTWHIQDDPTVSPDPTFVASDIKIATDGTYLYAYIDFYTLGASAYRLVLSNIDVTGQTYANYLMLPSNTTQNLVYNSDYLYGDGFIIDLNPGSWSIITQGTQRIDFNLLVSAGAIPARARYAYIYMSLNGGSYNRLMKIDFTVVAAIGGGTAPTSQTWDATPYFDTTSKHFYHRSSTISIRETDVEVSGAEISTDMGRAYGESGVVRYAAGQIVGVKTYVGNFYDVYSAQNFRNNVLANCVSGEGNQQIDVFDYLDPINVEYGDGDLIQAIADSNERILTLKKRSSILLSMDASGYQRETASRGVGCCSQASVVSYDDIVYWADYNGIYKHSTHSGVDLINPSWVVAWRDYTIAQREASLFVVDRENEALIVCIGSDIWQYDIGERETPQEETDSAQWMRLGYSDIPIAIKQNLDGYIDFLIVHTLTVTGKIFVISPSGDRCNSANFSFVWKSNKIEVLELEKKLENDVLILGFIINYISTFAFNLSLFLDDASSPIISNRLLPSGTHTVEVRAPLACRCKAHVIQLSGTTVQVADAIEIKFIHIYEQLVMTGDILTR